MSIVRMKKLRLLAVRGEKDNLLRELLRLGCVELREPEELLADEGFAARFRPESGNLTAWREEYALLGRALSILDREAPARKPLLAPKPRVSKSTVFDEQALAADLETAHRLVELDEHIRAAAEEELLLSQRIASLEPWREMELPLERRGSRLCSFHLGSMPASVSPQEAAEAAAAVSEASQLVFIHSDKEQHCVLVICLKTEAEAVLEPLRMRGFADVSFPGLTGTARENISLLQTEQRKLAARRRDLAATIAAEAPRRAALQLSADRVGLKIAGGEAAERIYSGGSVLVMDGWCPAERVSEVERLLAGADCAWEFSDPTEEEYPSVPVSLKNNRLTNPLNMVTNMYSLPAYDGIDPNPLMAPFFILFYGIMMADMGYGLLMMIGSLVLLGRMHPKGGMRNFAGLLGLCGITTFLFGAMTGGFFGDIIPQVAMLINPDTTLRELPSLFTPLDDTMMILIGSLCLGAIQTITGMVVSVVYKCRTGDTLSALFDECAWWLILAGLALALLKVGGRLGLVILAVGGLDLIVGQFVMKKGVFAALGGLVGAIYNGATGFFSDILSYSRLMALMLSGSIIASAFNTLGATSGNVVVLLVISLIGNALNFALNILGCYVHDLRLQCLEFFGRFYKDGGRPWQPLTMDNTKYTDIIKEEV